MITNFLYPRPATLSLSSIRVEDLVDAWARAAQDAEEALGAWRDAAPRERATGHAVYVAALDREEQAATALRLGVLAI